MFVIDVIPLVAHARVGTLSYRSQQALPVGTLTRVPLRSRPIAALVVRATPVIEAKADLKAADFRLRSGAMASLGTLPFGMVEAAEEVAREHATSLGSVLGALIAPLIPDSLNAARNSPNDFSESLGDLPYAARVAAYAAHAKSALRRKRSVILLAPTLAEAERLHASLAALSPVLLTSALSKKARAAALRAAFDGPRFVIATPGFAWLPVPALGAVIIERASAGTYQLPKRPYLDLRFAARALARHRGLSLLCGDALIPFELRPRPEKPLAASFTGSVVIIDARRGEDAPRQAFRAVPEPLLHAIAAATEKGGRAVVLAVRKGYAPSVICRDCGNLVRDERGFALALIGSGEHRLFRSADGITKRGADLACATCGSWNLMGLGVGVDRVAEELKEAIPDRPVVRFDPETQGGKKALDALRRRAMAPGAIIVGTESMRAHLDPAAPFALAAIASADTLLALPFWRARERLLRLALMLRERADTLYIATRVPDDAVFAAIRDPNDPAFFIEETMLRKALSYPPFGHLVVFHAEGTRGRVDAAAQAVQKMLAGHPAIRLADRKGARGAFRLSMVAKWADGAWPNGAVSRAIAALPPFISVHLDPDSLW